MKKRNPFQQGLLASIPIILGYLPVGIAFGVSARGAGLNTNLGLLVSLLIFAGGSQFALVELIKGGATIITTVLVSLGLNLRHILYGPAIAPYLNNTTYNEPRFISIISFGITDEVFASSMVYLSRIPLEERYWWILGIETGAYLSWIIGTWIGCSGSTTLLHISPIVAPALSFAPAGLFFALLLSMVKKHTLIPVIAAGGTTVIFKLLGLSSYAIIGAAFIGIFTGKLGKKLWKRP